MRNAGDARDPSWKSVGEWIGIKMRRVEFDLEGIYGNIDDGSQEMKRTQR